MNDQGRFGGVNPQAFKAFSLKNPALKHGFFTGYWLLDTCGCSAEKVFQSVSLRKTPTKGWGFSLTTYSSDMFYGVYHMGDV